jgi:uncharacterized protein (DUF362 family)
MDDQRKQDGDYPQNVSRRDIIRLITTAGLIAGCRSVEQTVAPSISPSATAPATATPTSTATPTPEATATPTTAPTASSTAAPTKTPTSPSTATAGSTPTEPPTAAPTPTPTSPPTATTTVAPIKESGRVVHTHHPNVWADDTLAPDVLRQMLDASITALTGLDEPDAAWSALFAPNERIAIKVNSISGSSFHTHAPLVMAVAEKLGQAGIAPEKIVIFDRSTSELERAGYPINRDGPGLRCYGTDQQYTAGWSMMDTEVRLSQILLDCDALINMPIIKQHGIAGISFAMKNHYGTFDKPGSFHGGRMERGMAELNALPPIKDRTRLIIGDALKITTRNWHTGVTGDSVLMSYDPVAFDAVGLQIYSDVMTSEGLNPGRAVQLATGWLASGAELGLGTNDPDRINRIEVMLG